MRGVAVVGWFLSVALVVTPGCDDSVQDRHWGDPVLIEINNAGGAAFPQVTVDVNGNAVAVWFQSDGTRNNIWANRFTPAGGWGGTEFIRPEGTAGFAEFPQVDWPTRLDSRRCRRVSVCLG